jgi:hypothetical protein
MDLGIEEEGKLIMMFAALRSYSESRNLPGVGF